MAGQDVARCGCHRACGLLLWATGGHGSLAAAGECGQISENVSFISAGARRHLTGEGGRPIRSLMKQIFTERLLYPRHNKSALWKGKPINPAYAYRTNLCWITTCDVCVHACMCDVMHGASGGWEHAKWVGTQSGGAVLQTDWPGHGCRSRWTLSRWTAGWNERSSHARIWGNHSNVLARARVAQITG